ncbi:MAG: GTP cyclohydrolase II [Tabrizicola sp.]|uniref:GTP cyclohydrolase II n=1 Tax=Tabrizicola sp. TaxID=2005166 RepID=UPI0027365EEF|nr:GTP cyclohydrolase II [Tabrizicola sp.]MDP3262291.1 GTP cyclohydrolase II [Tabrizicola sp.]MDP3647962.1 GTP cyclohydrolase II [Paracoccaceae bacterium]MDZ4066212.1 GTP cyclohydrolase II [Tabrizicola sp.]
MTLALSITERLTRARGDLRMGVPVVLSGGGEAALVVAVEALDAARLADLRGFGAPVLAITARRAETLKARAYDGDLARIALPADAGLDWVRALADPADDLRVPMKGPLQSLRDGRADLHRAALALAKSAHLLPAALVVPVAGAVPLAAANGLTLLTLEEVGPALLALSPMAEVVSARVPLAAAEAGRVHIFRPEDGTEEHYAIEIGKPDRKQPVLARIHSACFTGDVLGSLKCDCGPQLKAALQQMGAQGAGVLLYLNQEGRGIGLANKMRAYSLQDQGFDTVEANHRLGFEDDERDFRIGADILRRMGFSQVRLMTNNPRKIAMMEGCGLTVTERVPLHVGQTPENKAYLATKAAKSGHLS